MTAHRPIFTLLLYILALAIILSALVQVVTSQAQDSANAFIAFGLVPAAIAIFLRVKRPI